MAQAEEPSYEFPMPISQEPLIFRIRRGTALTDDEQRWEAAHTEENVRAIAETGQRMLYTHFYKGYGFRAEKEEMDLAAKVAGWARKYGMVPGVYMQWGTVVLETFLQETPKAANWILRDRDGHPVRIAYGQYYWRFLPDILNPEYMKWYKEKILRYCVENVKPKYIFLDNVAENPPVSWQPLHNPHWGEAFRKYLRDTYSPAELKSMLGFSNVDHVQPPYWEWDNAQVINDPLMQRWIDFRCRTVTEAVRDVRKYIYSQDSTAAVGVNIHGISRLNRAIQGLDPVAVCDGTGVDAWSGEIWVEAELTDDGVMISPIREYQACRTLGVAFQSGGRSALGRAVKMAFGYRRPIPGGGWLGSPGRESYLNGPGPSDRMYQYADYYRGTESMARVAVLRSYPSLAYNSFGPLAATVGFEQALICARVPFDIIFDRHLEDLSRYDVLVLANTECLSDRQVELIESFVRRGGGLVATGSSSLYNQWRRTRPEFGLGDVLGLDESDARRALRAWRVADGVWTYVGTQGAETIRRTHGDGRAVYIPRVIHSYAGNSVQMNLPENHEQLVDAVRWAIGGEFGVRVDAPSTVVINLLAKKDQGQIMLHMVNFRQDSLEEIPVELILEDGVKAVSIEQITGENPEKVKVEFTQQGRSLEFKVPELRLYTMLIIETDQ